MAIFLLYFHGSFFAFSLSKRWDTTEPSINIGRKPLTAQPPRPYSYLANHARPDLAEGQQFKVGGGSRLGWVNSSWFQGGGCWTTVHGLLGEGYGSIAKLTRTFAPPVNRRTDTSENTTLPHTTYLVANNWEQTYV